MRLPASAWHFRGCRYLPTTVAHSHWRQLFRLHIILMLIGPLASSSESSLSIANLLSTLRQQTTNTFEFIEIVQNWAVWMFDSISLSVQRFATIKRVLTYQLNICFGLAQRSICLQKLRHKIRRHLEWNLNLSFLFITTLFIMAKKMFLRNAACLCLKYIFYNVKTNANMCGLT